MSTQGERGTSTLGREASGGTNSAATSISGFQPPGLGENKLPPFERPVWGTVTATPGHRPSPLPRAGPAAPPHPEPSAPEAPHLPQRLTPPGPAGALPKELTGPTLGGAAMGYRLPDICHEGLRGPPCFSQTPWGVGEGCPLSREGDRGSQGLSRVQDKPGPREAGCCGACLALATRRTLPAPGDEGSHEALPHCHQGSRQRCRGAGQTLKWTAPSVPGRCSPRPLLTPPAT